MGRVASRPLLISRLLLRFCPLTASLCFLLCPGVLYNPGMDRDSLVTRVYLDGGRHVRVSETIGQVSELLVDAERDDGWAPFTDPGDERTKLIRASRVLWVEEEAEEA